MERENGLFDAVPKAADLDPMRAAINAWAEEMGDASACFGTHPMIQSEADVVVGGKTRRVRLTFEMLPESANGK